MKTETSNCASTTAQRIIKQRIAASKAYLPKHVAVAFAFCGQGILGVIARACGPSGTCGILMEEVADEVGCSVSMVRTTLRTAQKIGFVSVWHRPRINREIAPSGVTIEDKTWCAQIAERCPRKAWK